MEIFIVLVAAAVPAFIALARGHQSKGAIIALDVIACLIPIGFIPAWPFASILWIVAFIWSLTGTKPRVVYVGTNGAVIQPEAAVEAPSEPDEWNIKAGHIIALLAVFGLFLAVLISSIH